MSYDLRIGVKVAGAEDLHVVIDHPEYDSPTYNLGKMFRACTGWDFDQGEWYRVSDVLPLIQRGISELKFHPSKYKQYNAPNGCGDTSSALTALESLAECIAHNSDESDYSWNGVPLDLMYVRW